MAEGSPEELLRRYNAQTVEEVFLQLSQKQEGPMLPQSVPAEEVWTPN